MCKTSTCSSYDAMCQAVLSYQSLAKKMLFNSSCVSSQFAQSHSLYNTSLWPFSAAMCQAVFSSQSLGKNMLFNTLCISISLAQSHRLCNDSILSFTDAMFQAVLSYPSLAKNILFNTLRTGAFKLFKCTFPGSKQFKSTFILCLFKNL